MKQIEPVQIWKNGEVKTASVLDATIINDNLETSCVFYWFLKEADTEESLGAVLADGNLTMGGEDYLNWDGANDYAYIYIGSKINVTIK